MKIKYLAALVAALCASSSWAVQPFVVKDIRVEGIQRTEAGTVFSYLPVKVGDTLDDEKAAAAIKALYATGFFKDVRLESENGVLLVVLDWRLAILSTVLLPAFVLPIKHVGKVRKSFKRQAQHFFDRITADERFLRFVPRPWCGTFSRRSR